MARPSKKTFLAYGKVNASVREIEVNLMNGRLAEALAILDPLDSQLGDLEQSIKQDVSEQG
jgi:hypothetical protein